MSFQTSRVSVAFGSTTLSASPAWESVDGHVTGWTVDRGRQFELDQTQAGTATVTLVDATGLLDVLNALSAYNGELTPLKQIRIQEDNPDDGLTYTHFTGFIEDWDYTVDIAEAQLTITLSCVDAFDILSNTEVVPDATGQASYARQQVDDAMRARLADAGWDALLTNVFTGNVYVKPVVYQAGTDILTTLQDCADSEFPGVGNIFISSSGIYAFRGRKARFDPSGYIPGDGVRTSSKPMLEWDAGDVPGRVGKTGWAKIASIGWANHKDKIINAALMLPEGVLPQDVAGQLYTDSGSIAALGTRAFKQDGLLCDGNVNSGTTDLQECLLFGKYLVMNYKTPLPQISNLVFQTPDPDAADAETVATRKLMCGVEISDLINLVTVDPGGGGFNAGYFVEGVHQTAELGNGGKVLKRTCTLDVSPQALYPAYGDPGNPFAATDT